jgi:hypothetical protein
MQYLEPKNELKSFSCLAAISMTCWFRKIVKEYVQHNINTADTCMCLIYNTNLKEKTSHTRWLIGNMEGMCGSVLMFWERSKGWYVEKQRLN